MIALRPLLLLPLVFGLTGCPYLPNVPGMQTGGLEQQQQAVAPQIETNPPTLRRYPDLRMLAAYYCPQVLDNPIARMGCGVALGPQPQLAQLVFEFGMTITAKNPNKIPIPALDVLLAMTLFPGQDAEGLGAVCVSMCTQDDPTCNGAPRPGACTSSQSDIRRIEDFAARVPGLISDVLTGKAQEELRKYTIPSGGDIQLDLSFTLGIEQALRILQKLANRFVQDVMSGKSNGLSIPVSAQGTVFVQLPVAGRIGVGFGPLTSAWQIPVQLPK